MNILELKL